ncbi:unnamed protein product [Staurois parvus]|uniref:SH3 domain-containing protein n=1 Tax=Staurois parvus TaxID=386267 RepID=A0ABN9ECM6_9NEOB|nr:unnamed protein product [Staurois parvus]
MTSGAQNLRSRFENMAKTAEEENQKKAEEERARRQKRDKVERQEQVKKEVQENVETEVSQSQEVPLPLPVPVPRVSIVTSQPAEEDDPDYEAPPMVPPKVPMMMAPVPYADESGFEEETYEDIIVPQPISDDEYEAIPDPPPRVEEEEEDGDDYECILDQPVRKQEGLYEELPKDGTSTPSAIALYDYAAGGDDEISFEPQDIITDIEMVDEGWWTGSCNGRRGLFPATYVELMQ